MLRDPDIRAAILASLAGASGLVLEELNVGLYHARIDVAHLTPEQWTGYEIKSDTDTCRRLPEQARWYGLVFDRLVAVIAERHLAEVQSVVPEWWGIVLARPDGGGVRLETVRGAGRNPAVNPEWVAHMLWRPEMQEVVLQIGLRRSLRYRSRNVMVKAIVDALPLPELRREVTERISRRTDWLETRRAGLGMAAVREWENC